VSTGGKQQHVVAIARPEVPPAGVAAQPGGAGAAGQLADRGEPRRVEIGGLVEVDVEEVVGGRQAGGDPARGVGVEPLGHLDAQLEEAGELRMGGAQRVDVERAGGVAGAVLGGHAEPEARQRPDAIGEATHRVRSLPVL
jgi:hypothetical protein